MTNREKYREQLLDIALSGDMIGFVKGAPVGCHKVDCRTCDMYDICAEDVEAELKYREEWAKADALGVSIDELVYGKEVEA